VTVRPYVPRRKPISTSTKIEQARMTTVTMALVARRAHPFTTLLLRPGALGLPQLGLSGVLL